MIRMLYHVVPFLVPFAVYAIYVYWRKRQPNAAEHMHDTPWYWLVVTGMSLSIASVVALWLYGSSPPDGEYQPATSQGGKIQRGKIE
jgi:hypothetical protein